MGRNKKKRRDQEEIKIYCFYCDRQFKDEEILIDHQRAKHYKCEVCNKKLSTAQGLATHCFQVHRVEIKAVPNARENRSSMDYEIYGMAGVEEALRDLGELPDEPEPKEAKLGETAPAAPMGGMVPPPMASMAPPSPQSYGQPPFPYAPPPQPGYGYPPAPMHPYGQAPAWPPHPGAGAPPPMSGAYGHVPAPQPFPNMGAPPPSSHPLAAPPPMSAPPRGPLFPVAAGSAAPAAPPAVSASQQQQQQQHGRPQSQADANGASDGLVWNDADHSMEERRASLPKYVTLPHPPLSPR
uniref:Zinc finger family protein n=1 Tax=Tetraselmis sp. GSL018 TaxID=582737 RepID=A0A061QZT6_9CHLO